MSWGPLGTLAEKPSPVAGNEAGAEPFPWLERVPGCSEVQHGGRTVSCLKMPRSAKGDSPALDASTAVPTPAAGCCWGDGLGLWASGRTKEKKKRCLGQHGGTPWGCQIKEQPPNPFSLLPQQ